MRQYFFSDDFDLKFSKSLVLNKIENQLRLLKSRGKLISRTKQEIRNLINQAENLETLRGIEGNFSKEFFSAYFKEIGWFARMPRVKPDAVNFLLDMGYTLLFNFIDALLNLFGFDTYKGFYHKLFFQRKSLSCDIIEPFRCIVDREVLKIFNLKIFNEKDFKAKDSKVYMLYSKSTKYASVFLETIMKNKEEIYKYIRDFYHFVMDSEKYNFPYFKVSR
ncbi:MAG: hypothetical protein KatS3mg098_055 [Candidatus Parcubacteria bacterium]|nr:MAG: hypothetical protein KatS3mg098_055 [Candidatus Parcubacteria bacterium]